ncbi:NACHT domain-containing protein [Streptomyces sp. NBC_00006]|uniref:NACHT domain-containing protein n=1 Tax=Streptomyces sp. NBC_00006 TaxID=2975619 RepID=UPI00225B7FF0|nr:NACHT domain-containing protein [Streptomyces sp. NBC_00006]MCX5529803.1 NACHT domain-containing protein [Streptomyces sp. NBC_00006]
MIVMMLIMAAALLLPGAKRGDVDPVGALVGIAGLVATVWLGWRQIHGAEVDVVAASAALALKVSHAETGARKQMLGHEPTPIDVRFVLHPAPRFDAAGAGQEGLLTEVADYYRRLQPGRLVVTGAPGSGKTMLAVELILALIGERRERDAVPVRLSLSSWSEVAPIDWSEAVPIEDQTDRLTSWVSRTLMENYQLTWNVATALVENHMIVPVLDGLDEMDAADADTPLYKSRARQALGVLNDYQHSGTRASLILTCRTDRYQDLEALEVWARDAARIEIAPVNTLQTREFLERVTDESRWRPVLDELDANPTGPLARSLSTPWRLSVAVIVYERDRSTGRYTNSPIELINPALQSEQQLRDHLIRRLITVRSTRHPPPGRASPTQVRAWLGVLAVYLHTNLRANVCVGRLVDGVTLSSVDLVPHELWPLADRRRLRSALLLLLTAVAWLVAAVYGTCLVVLGSEDPSLGQVCGKAAIVGGLLNAALPWLAWEAPQTASRLDLGLLRTPHRWLSADGLGEEVRSAVDPREPLQVDLAFKVACGLAFGVAAGCVVWIACRPWFDGVEIRIGDLYTHRPEDTVIGSLDAFPDWLGVGALGELMLGGIVGTAVGLARATAVKYVALLMCTRHRPQALPWRLGRFLGWAEEAGLLRVAGTAYQFRHLELQDWLADPAQRD